MAVSALSRINGLPARAAEAELMSCCASPVWARAVAARRPYPNTEAVTAAGAAALAALPWPQVEQALAAHPRIGARPQGDRRDAAWSRREQAGLDQDDGRTLAAQGRLSNDEASEQQVIRDELGKIVALRLERLSGACGAVTG